MAIDREKVSTAAQKYVEKKKYDKAVLEYQKLVQADPNDARTLLKIGDLQLKMGAHEQAIATYESVGNLYAKQGWALKAIAVYKQIREIIAKHVPHLDEKYGHIAPRLAELYQQLGLTSDALAALDEVATKLQRQQRDGEAIEVFQKIVALDPTNPLPHLRLAEALSRSKDIDGAVFEFKTAAAQLAGLGRRDDALKVLERLLHHKPDAEQARIAAELYLSRGQQQDGMQALAKLQICFQANPRDLDTLQLLARAFNAIGQSGKAIEVQKEMARIARDAGKTDLAREIIERLMRLAPNDDGVRKLALGSVPAPAPIHSQAPQAGMTAPPQAGMMTQPIAGGRPGGAQQYPPPPPAVTRATSPTPFAPQGAPHASVRPPIPSGPMLTQQPQEEDDVEEVDELSYEDATDDVESVDEQAELVDNDQIDGHGGQAYADPNAVEQEYDADGQAYELNPDDPQYADPNAAYADPNAGDATEATEEGAESAYADSAAEGGEIQYQGEAEGGEYQEEQVYAEQHEYAEGDGQYEAQAGEDVGAQLAQLLADAQSYRRLRLYAKATETLRSGLDLEPRSMDVREALRDTLLEAGHNEDAVLEMLAIAGLYIDALDGESAARALQDVLALDPTNQRAIEMLQELGYEIVDESEGEGEVQDTEAGQRGAYSPAAAGGDEDRLPSYDLEEMGPEDVSARYTGESRRIRPSSQRPPPMQDQGQADDDGALPSFPLDGPEEYEPESHAPSTRPGEHQGYADEAGHDTGENYQAGGHTDGTDQHGAYAEEAAPATVAPAAPAYGGGGGSAELEEALEESEFFVSRGLYEDARAILADHFARNPNHPLLRERIAEIDAQLEEMRGVQGGSGARERPQEDRSFDIAANIDSLDSIETGAPPQQAFQQEQQQVDVEEVFAKFKEGVAAQISIEDSESHENLGIAYKEMGLTDDAVREFEIAARDPKRECVCQFNIGMVEMERGRIAEAIDAFLRGLNATEKEPQQETMLCYEIGAAYEAMKMNREALTYFQKTMRRDPAYRDVQERVRRLAKPEPKAAPIKAAVGADDEFDRAFDDLLGGKS